MRLFPVSLIGTMNALYEYFFPPAAQPPKEAPPKNPTICFSRNNELYTVSLSDIAKMSAMELRFWRPMITAHQLETYDEDECENAGLILAELERCLLLREAHHPK